MKTHIPTILCPVDFSAPSRTAARYAAAIADHFGARLIVLSVEEPLLVEAAADIGASEAFGAATRHELHHFLDEDLADTAAGPGTSEFHVAVGEAASEILRHAREEAADLIVIGSHGRSGLRKMFFGSTAERVLRETTVPVLVTPRHGPPTTHLSEMARHIGRVVAPVDLTAGSPRQVAIAAGIAEALGASLIVAHVLEPAFVPATVRAGLTGADAARRAQIEEQLSALLERPGARARTESLILSGDPSEEIVKLAEARRAGLIVIGLHSTGLLGPRMGTVTYRVLCLTNAVVLALPPRTSGSRAVVQPTSPTREAEPQEASCSI